MGLQVMKIYKNGIARYKIDKEIQRLLDIWDNPNPSTEDIIDFFRLSLTYPNVDLVRVDGT